jgi:Family of unknown function (DUF5681)
MALISIIPIDKSFFKYNNITRKRFAWEESMKFQPGESGNPAGRPPGARNKKTIAMEEYFVARAQRAVDRILFLAEGGHPVAMRICAERAMPTGTNRGLALELPKIRCADDAQAALDMVLEAFGREAITVRELPSVLASVERAVRIAGRIQHIREREQEGRQITGELHPAMLPRPGADPMEPTLAAVEREEDPWSEHPGAVAADPAGEGLYSPVNSSEESSGAADETSPNAGEPSAAGDAGLYFPVNSGDETANATEQEVSCEAAGQADSLYFPVNSSDAETAGAPAPGGSSEAAGQVEGLYFPVNSSAMEGDGQRDERAGAG